MKRFQDLAMLGLSLFCGYAGTAFLVFAWRHPWMTDTQRLLHAWDALCFNQLPMP